MWKAATLTLALLGAVAPTSLAQKSESPKDIIAAHIRAQGYTCDAPQNATRQPRASRPDEQAWLLKCTNANYLVRLIPDMAAIVESAPGKQR